ncbi:unnamed protein product [Schistocephalus solidus]|uniref:Anaphase-promoting complex subunit 13 n=1 Tax=Schistocephalus solidus TaxID=70667 RepID=A0A183T3R2_SCHSO|nr:unnamed protein product [Schistocephalus solidus]
MSDSTYTASGIFLDVVDADWVQQALPFEDILINTDLLPTSEPELGVGSQSQTLAEDRVAWSEHHLEDLLLPRKNGAKAATVDTPALPFPCFGFTAYGLFEPMLADACRLLGGSTQLAPIATLDLYNSALEQLRGDLLSALSSLFQLSAQQGQLQQEGKDDEEESILSDSVALLISDAASLQAELSTFAAKQPS